MRPRYGIAMKSLLEYRRLSYKIHLPPPVSRLFNRMTEMPRVSMSWAWARAFSMTMTMTLSYKWFSAGLIVSTSRTMHNCFYCRFQTFSFCYFIILDARTVPPFAFSIQISNEYIHIGTYDVNTERVKSFFVC